MAQTVSYGMGQYRYNENFNYKTQLDAIGSNDIDYLIYNPNGISNYQDIKIKLPDGIEYGESYYVELGLPKNPSYNLTVNVRLCAEESVEGPIDINKFQQIQQITIPAIGEDNSYTEVVLYQIDKSNNGSIYAEIPKNYSSTTTSIISGCVYKNNNIYQHCTTTFNNIDDDNRKNIWNNNNTNYFITLGNDNNPYTIYNLQKGWNTAAITNNIDNISSFKFIFSPKYNLSQQYRYLWLEIVHNNDDNVYYLDDNVVYSGNRIPKNGVTCSIYKITNLLAKDNPGIAPIKSGTTNLNAITATGPTDLQLVINGEDIKIGITGQYILENFDITFLGVIPNLDNPDFLIEYTYKIES